MQRTMMERLVAWKNSAGRMPLVLSGARQVGKTWLLGQFGAQHYSTTVYLNFEANSALSRDFEGNLDPGRIISLLEAYTSKRIFPDSTLIVFDEVQACPRALTSLKYFRENAPQYHIVAAGSTLGIAVKDKTVSFPVGNVEQLTLHPFDFMEFLLALNEGQLIAAIMESYEKSIPLPESLHAKALEHYRMYLVTGGMPGVLKAYFQDRSVLAVAEVQTNLLSSYIADMTKYASPSDTAKIIACFDSIPSQLAKENRKFQYKVVRKGGSATLFGASLDWLAAAGIVAKCERVESGTLPLAAYRDLSAFKLFMGDVGLLVAKSGIPVQMLLSEHAGVTFSGAIAENYVAQALQAKGYPLFYWESEGKAEVDFLLQKSGRIVPIEVKSGEHVKSRSLSVYKDRYKPEFCIRLSQKRFGIENGIKSVPLYAAFCL